MTEAPEVDGLPGLLGDDPVENEADDLLRRGPFAARATELIQHVSAETPSAVLALLGPWGSGKTTVINFVKARLNEEDSWTVVEFNPWMVSDLSSLVFEFFAALTGALSEESGASLREKLARYAKSVSPLASPLKLLGVDAKAVLEDFSLLLAGDNSLDRRRRDLEEALNERDKPILLVADDLDRLHPDELTLFFKLVRLVGRLPRVYYLLAFDEETVLDVLGATELTGASRNRAAAYLEKMVQVRLDLPPVHPSLALDLLNRAFDIILERNRVALDDEGARRLSEAYSQHLSKFLRDPRQIKRYCAQIEALYPLLAAEVDFVDFAIVTFVRTFQPGVVLALLPLKDELTGTKVEIGNKPSPEQRVRRWLDRLRSAGVADQHLDSTLQLLGQLFLPIRGALNGSSYTSTLYAQLTAARRAGSSEYFDRYFHLGISPRDISDARVVDALAEIVDGHHGSAVSELVEVLAFNSELVLDKMRRLTPPTPMVAAAVLLFLASIADEIPESGLFDRSAFVFRYWASDLILMAQGPGMDGLATEIVRKSDVAFLTDIVARAKRIASDEERETAPEFDQFVATTINILQAELNRQSGRSVDETHDVLALAIAWGHLEPTTNRQTWFRDVLEAGPFWRIPRVLGLFVPISTIVGTDVQSLGDPDLSLIDELIGLQYVAGKLVLESGLEPLELDENDVSWEARVAKCVRAVAHWAGREASTKKRAPSVEILEAELAAGRRPSDRQGGLP